MKEKGFKLIELLAVIVILAIIALIATPIILNIIDDAREESNKRSIEMYANAIRNTIAKEYLNGSDTIEGTFTNTNLPFEVEYDGNVECSEIDIYEDGNIYLANCTVNGDLVEGYEYGTKQELGTAKPCTVAKTNTEKYSIGDVVTCTFEESTEQFYVIENEDEDTTEGMSMLAMYNLYVGNSFDQSSLETTPLENPTGIQNSLAKGYIEGDAPIYGTVAFSTTNYWLSETKYPVYVYNDQADVIYSYVNAYETYLKENGLNSASATLISYEQVNDLKTNQGNPSWLYSTNYWTGYATYSNHVGFVCEGGFSDFGGYTNDSSHGVRPVITISTSDIN